MTAIAQLDPINVALANTSETTVIASSAKARKFDYGRLQNSSTSTAPSATIKIKNGSGTTVETFVNVAVGKADGATVGSGTALVWDTTCPLRLPANWTVTAQASAGNVLSFAAGGVEITP